MSYIQAGDLPKTSFLRITNSRHPKPRRKPNTLSWYFKMILCLWLIFPNALEQYFCYCFALSKKNKQTKNKNILGRSIFQTFCACPDNFLHPYLILYGNIANNFCDYDCCAGGAMEHCRNCSDKLFLSKSELNNFPFTCFVTFSHQILKMAPCIWSLLIVIFCWH